MQSRRKIAKRPTTEVEVHLWDEREVKLNQKPFRLVPQYIRAMLAIHVHRTVCWINNNDCAHCYGAQPAELAYVPGHRPRTRNAYFLIFVIKARCAHLLKANYLWVSSNRPLSWNHCNEFHWSALASSTVVFERRNVVYNGKRQNKRAKCQTQNETKEMAKTERMFLLKSIRLRRGNYIGK